MTRGAMTAAMDRVLGSLVSRNTEGLAGARYTENGQELAIGDGLWATCDAIGPYRHDFIDADGDGAACFTTVAEGKARAIMALRIGLSEDTVKQIEAVIVRPSLMGSVAAYADGPDRLDEACKPDDAWYAPIPPEERMSREELRRIADAYFSAIQGNDGKGLYPFSDDCIRMEHGYRTSGESDALDAGLARDPDTPYTPDLKAMGVREQFETGFFRFVTNIRDRRFITIDPALGVVCALALFDHSGTVRDYHLADGTPVHANLSQPFTWQIAEAFRIERGLITRIEAILQPCPYGMKPGW